MERRGFANQENVAPFANGVLPSSAPISTKRDDPKNQIDETEILVEEKETDKYGKVTTRNYMRQKFLGKGGFARCYEMRDLGTNKIYAGKIIAKSSLVKPRAQQKLITEIKIHHSLNHRHIVHFDRFFEDSNNVYILLELCNQKSMMDLLKARKRLSEMETRYYMLQIISAVQNMHSNRVIHRDLKLGNLFLHNMMIKIGDFGLAAKLDYDGERKKTICGTPNYIAPEILEGTGGHSYEVDIWSLGVILYTLLVGKPPFETNDVKTTYNKIRANEYSFPISVPISESAKNLITKILNTVPEYRPTLTEILEHKFFNGYTPTTLSPSALHSMPAQPSISPTKNTILSEAAKDKDKNFHTLTSASSNTMYSPTRQPLSEKTNSGALPFSHHTHSSHQAVEKVASAQIDDNTTTEPTTSEEIQLRKMRKVEIKATPRMSEADVKLKLLKTKLTTGSTLPTNNYNSHSSLPSNNIPSSISHTSANTFSSTTSTLHSTAISHISSSSNTQNSTSNNTSPTLIVNDDDEEGHLSYLHQKLVDSFMAMKTSTLSTKGTTSPLEQGNMVPNIVLPPEMNVWVLKWVDYSNKYGLGYVLSNGVVGASFNDGSKMVMGFDRNKVEYIEVKKYEDGSLREERRIIRLHDAHTHDIQKKLTLINYFNGHFEGQVSSLSATKPMSTLSSPSKLKSNQSTNINPLVVYGHGPFTPISNMPYIKKWLKRSHATIFRLNNKTFQVNFLDHTTVILYAEAQVVTFIDQQQNAITRTLSGLNIDPSLSIDFIERLKYTRDVLYHMVSSTHKKTTK